MRHPTQKDMMAILIPDEDHTMDDTSNVGREVVDQRYLDPECWDAYPVVTEAMLTGRFAVLNTYAQMPGLLSAKLRRAIERELRIERSALTALLSAPFGEEKPRGRTSSIQAILLDPLLPRLNSDLQRDRARQILDATQPSARWTRWSPLRGGPKATARGIATPATYPRITFNDAMKLAAATTVAAGEQDWTAPGNTAPGDDSPKPSLAGPQRRRRLTVAQVRQALDDLLAEWACYRLDTDAWYITKPLLHDTTGTVPTTVAYEKAMQDLVAAIDDLPQEPPQSRIDAAADLADIAWQAWHAANEHAARVGLGDRTPTERAMLERLGKLVERLTLSVATDPEIPMVKREIQSCLDKITTVSVSWSDIATLPAIEAAGLLPQLPATATGMD